MLVSRTGPSGGRLTSSAQIDRITARRQTQLLPRNPEPSIWRQIKQLSVSAETPPAVTHLAPPRRLALLQNGESHASFQPVASCHFEATEFTSVFSYDPITVSAPPTPLKTGEMGADFGEAALEQRASALVGGASHVCHADSYLPFTKEKQSRSFFCLHTKP